MPENVKPASDQQTPVEAHREAEAVPKEEARVPANKKLSVRYDGPSGVLQHGEHTFRYGAVTSIARRDLDELRQHLARASGPNGAPHIFTEVDE